MIGEILPVALIQRSFHEPADLVCNYTANVPGIFVFKIGEWYFVVTQGSLHIFPHLKLEVSALDCSILILVSTEHSPSQAHVLMVKNVRLNKRVRLEFGKVTVHEEIW